MVTDTLRDQKTGLFKPGHPYIKPQPGVKVGRPKTVSGLVKDALSIAENSMPVIITMLVEKAKTGDVDAAKYLTDRIYGKANQPISSNAPWEIIITYGGRLDQVETSQNAQQMALNSGEVVQDTSDL